MAENEKPLRKNELKIIALLSSMIRQYKKTNTLDDVNNLICKTANEILEVCDGKTSNDASALPITDVSGWFSVGTVSANKMPKSEDIEVMFESGKIMDYDVQPWPYEMVTHWRKKPCR